MNIPIYTFAHSEQEQVRVGCAQALIDLVQAPLSDGEEREIVNVISEESMQVAQACHQEYREKLAEIKATEQEAHTRLEQHRPLLAEAEQELRANQAEPSLRIKAAIFIGCFIACFIAEFALTWYTLPFVLSVRQFSFVGVMLAVAPTTALVVLDVVLARLLEEPWQQARLTGSAGQRKASWLAMGAFLLALGTLNLFTVSWLAEAREEAIKAKRNLERQAGESEVMVNTAVLNRAVLAVSISVALDGALFCLIGLAEWRRLRAWLRSRDQVAQLRAEHQTLESHHTQAEARVARQQALGEQIAARADAAAAHYRARHLFLLEQAIKRACPPRSTRERVNDILRKSVRAAGEAKRAAAPPFAPAAA